MVIDEARGRAWLALREGAGPTLNGYDVETGKLLGRHGLPSRLQLIGHDTASDQLLLLDIDGQLHHFDIKGDALADIPPVTITGPVSILPREQSGAFGRIRSMTPRMRDDSGLLLVAGPSTLATHDPATGALIRSYALPFPEEDMILYAALSSDRRLLYVAAATGAMMTWEGGYGTRIAAINLATGESIEEHLVPAVIQGWLAWDDSLLVSWGEYKDAGSREALWVGGRRTREATESRITWLAHDPTSNQIMGWWGDWPYVSPFGATVTANPTNLRLSSIEYVESPESFAAARWGNGPLYRIASAFDATRRQFIVWTGKPNRLVTLAVGSPASDEPESRPSTPSPGARLTAIRRAGVNTGRPEVLISTHIATSPAATRRHDLLPNTRDILSTDGGRTWHERSRVGPRRWPRCSIASPSVADQSLLACLDGLGVIRSDDGGISWHPATDGIGSRSIREISLSPTFDRDGTVFATTFSGMQTRSDGTAATTAWRSTDAGESWRPIGSYAALALSPDYATDRRVMAFEYLGPRFHMSTDGGRSWQARGRLPELMFDDFKGTRLWVIPAHGDREERLLALAASEGSGGGPHWPFYGARLFQSRDGGWTWDLAWEANEDPSGNITFDGELFGPFDLDEHNSDRWLLSSNPHSRDERARVFMSVGDTWWAGKRIRGPKESRIFAVTEDGKIEVISGGLDTIRELDPDDLVLESQFENP